ncbi:hypothetical protein AAMO2058_000861400 [Amorphochlora amoebiformis]
MRVDISKVPCIFPATSSKVNSMMFICQNHPSSNPFARDTITNSITITDEAAKLAKNLVEKKKKMVIFHCMYSQQRGPKCAYRFYQRSGLFYVESVFSINLLTTPILPEFIEKCESDF